MRQAIRSGRMTREELAISNEELLKKLDLFKDGKLKRAAVLCFCREPERILADCYVKIGKFGGSEILYQDEVHGSLMLMESHASRPFNPDIARVFYRAGYIENWVSFNYKSTSFCFIDSTLTAAVFQT